MKNLLFVIVLGSAALTSVHARDVATVVCGKPKLTTNGFAVLVTVTNISTEPIAFNTAWPDDLHEYATRPGRPDRWIRLNPPLREYGGCMGVAPTPKPTTHTLAAGESYETTKNVSVSYEGGAYFISMELTRPESPKRVPAKVATAPILLRWNPQG